MGTLAVTTCDRQLAESANSLLASTRCASHKGDNGVEYSSNLISPMVTRSLPSVTMRDGAWEWGYLGFETSKEVRKASLECAGVRSIVVAYDDKETRKALRQVGIAVPANAMPPPTK